MAGSVIKGDIQRNGFLDKSGDGTAGQVRTLNSSDEEVWADAPGAGTATGHIIENAAGEDLVARGNLQFVGATVSDDAANDRTIVEVTQGERIVIGEDQFKVETADGLPFLPPRDNPGAAGDAIEVFNPVFNTATVPRFIGVKYAVTYAPDSSAFYIWDIDSNSVVQSVNGPSGITGLSIVGETVYYSSNNQIFSFTVGEITHTTEYNNGDNQQPLAIAVIGTTVYFVTTSTGQLRRVDTVSTSTLITTQSLQELGTDGTQIYSNISNSIIRLNPADATPTFSTVTAITNASPVSSSYINSDGINIFYITNTTSTNPFGIYNVSANTISTQSNPPNLSSIPSGATSWGRSSIGEVAYTPPGSSRVAFFFGQLSYTQTLALPNVTINTDTDKYMYNTTSGVLEIIDEEHYDMNFSLNITNSATFSGTGYQLFLDIDGLNSGTIVDELLTGTTTYNVTVPASIHRGNDIRIREFVPDPTTINAITTSWSAGSSWAVDEAAISGLQTSKVTLDPSAVTAGAASVTHNLNNRYLTVWVVYNGRTASPRQEPIDTFTIASNDTIDVTGLATDADIASYTFLIQGF